jgi:hypothetical protein
LFCDGLTWVQLQSYAVPVIRFTRVTLLPGRFSQPNKGLDVFWIEVNSSLECLRSISWSLVFQ